MVYIRIVPINWGYFLFKLIGDLHFYVSSGRKRKISCTIQTLLNIEQKVTMDIVKKYYETHYLDGLHIFLCPKLPKDNKFGEYGYFENIDLLERELINWIGCL